MEALCMDYTVSLSRHGFRRVCESRAERGHVQEFDEELAERIFRHGFRTVTPNGILGDARGMSAAIGERCIANTTDGIADALSASD